MKTDPLIQLIENYPFDINLIKDIQIGLKNTGIMLKNGQIGVCANLNNQPPVNLKQLDDLDIHNSAHRVIAIAYLNAHINYEKTSYDSGDIFTSIEFSDYKNIVMIGHFRPLVEKFTTNSISLSIFDIKENDPVIIPMKKMSHHLKQADVVILTATSLINNTFCDIVNSSNGKVFILGPSSILSDTFFSYPNVTAIYGTHFIKYDDRILSIIAQGGGTRDFQKYGRKIILNHEETEIIKDYF